MSNNYIQVLSNGLATKSALLMKTNQTASFRTGDDGDLEAGRGSSFLVLPGNNPFGNTNRTTAPDGTQTYTGHIIIDWSTYDGTNVLGWYSVVQSAAIWNTAIDNCLAFTTGSYTSGWRMPNVMEALSIVDWSRTSDYYNYAPFSLGAGNMWTSTGQGAYGPNNVYIIWAGSVPITYLGKTSSIAYMICRTFAVTGTTLT